MATPDPDFGPLNRKIDELQALIGPVPQRVAQRTTAELEADVAALRAALKTLTETGRHLLRGIVTYNALRSEIEKCEMLL